MNKYNKKVNIRLSKEQFDDLSALLKDGESVSDFIRTAVDCLIVSRASSSQRQKVT